MITAPCKVCGVQLQIESIAAPCFCGPACESLHAHRQASREQGARPGDPDYHAENSIQRNLHRTTRTQRLRNTP